MDAIQAAHPTAALLGTMAGGALAIIILSMLLEKLIFSQVFDDPVMGKGFTVVTAWIVASLVWGLNKAGWQGFNPNGLWIYGVPALLVLLWYMRQGFRLRGMQDELEAGQMDHGAARPFE